MVDRAEHELEVRALESGRRLRERFRRGCRMPVAGWVLVLLNHDRSPSIPVTIPDLAYHPIKEDGEKAGNL